MPLMFLKFILKIVMVFFTKFLIDYLFYLIDNQLFLLSNSLDYKLSILATHLIN